MVDLRADDALVVVDVQRDFLPGGAPPCPKATRSCPAINPFTLGRFERARAGWSCSRATGIRPTMSFRAQGGPWPPLRRRNAWRRIRAGAGPAGDGAGGLEGRLRPDAGPIRAEGTELAARLRQRGIKRLFVGGLATDHCVRATVLDALREGSEVWLLARCGALRSMSGRATANAPCGTCSGGRRRTTRHGAD